MKRVSSLFGCRVSLVFLFARRCATEDERSRPPSKGEVMSDCLLQARAVTTGKSARKSSRWPDARRDLPADPEREWPSEDLLDLEENRRGGSHASAILFAGCLVASIALAVPFDWLLRPLLGGGGQ